MPKKIVLEYKNLGQGREEMVWAGYLMLEDGTRRSVGGTDSHLDIAIGIAETSDTEVSVCFQWNGEEYEVPYEVAIDFCATVEWIRQHNLKHLCDAEWI